MRNKFFLMGVCALFVLWAVASGSAQTYQGLQITNQPTAQTTGNNSAVVQWMTNQSSGSMVRYGTDPNNLNQVAQGSMGVTSHQVALQNLQPNTTYYIQAVSPGQGTGQAVSPIMQFSTSNGQTGYNGNYNQSAGYGGYNQPAGTQSNNQNVQITNGPTANSVSNNQATVTWSTTAPSSSVVKYGTNPNNLAQTAQAPWGAVNHQVTLNNLNPNTTYYFQVQSAQGQGTGTMAQSGTEQFQTPQ
jgi:immunomodulating metalloprotease